MGHTCGLLQVTEAEQMFHHQKDELFFHRTGSL